MCIITIHFGSQFFFSFLLNTYSTYYWSQVVDNKSEITLLVYILKLIAQQHCPRPWNWLYWFYKILNQGQPVYLRELIHRYTSSRNTRGSTPKLKFLHTSTFDRRVHKSIKHFSNSFSHYAPVLWNSFPFQIRNSPSVASFRKRLKTYLYNSSFPT